jgi:SpoVK/Ycf46/Vps4 family AAA+-type ATPase
VSLRRDIESKNVTREDFRDALERIKPSVTPDMENWYQGFGKRFKKERAPVPIT